MAALEFEEMSRDAAQVQKRVLRSILQDNATCEYLRMCGLGSTSELARVDDEELVRRFKERVPVASHSHFMPFIQRVLDGDTSPILTCVPVRGVCLSSGTSNGNEKYIPYFDGLRTGTLEVARIATAFRDRVYPLTSGARILEFNFMGKFSTAKGGLRVGTASSFLTHDDAYKIRQQKMLLTSCSPPEVALACNFEQGMYCHLLCGLKYANEVEVISSIFGYIMVEALRTLEVQWQSLCHDIKVGHLNKKITDTCLRAIIMSKVLTKPNAQVADKLIATCTEASLSSSWKGIVKQIWPRCKYVLSIVTGSMETYVDTLKYYMGDKIVLVSADYGATEGWVAVNINPSAQPDNVSFTIVPSLAYFEFIPLSRTKYEEYLSPSLFSSSHLHAFKDQKIPIDLTEVKVGQDYEIVITTSGGLYRYRLGDVLRITGFFNCTPQFAYVCHKDVILSINVDKIIEEDLKLVMHKVSKKLQARSTLKLVDYTSYADIKNFPRHYIIFWEVEHGQVETLENQKLLATCATWIDAALIEPGYVIARKRATIGGLELCIVKEGTFKILLDCFMARSGASISQYKTPRCILGSSSNMLLILKENTIATFRSSLTF